MKEIVTIVVHHSIAPVDLHAFRDIIRDVLAESGTECEVKVEEMPKAPFFDNLVRPRVVLDWQAAYGFKSPDEKLDFGDFLTFTMSGGALNHEFLMTALLARSNAINKAYRKALVAVNTYVSDTGPDNATIVETVSALLAELPETQ